MYSPFLQVSLPTQYNDQQQAPVGALSGALGRIQANRPLRELREIAKGVTKQLPEAFQVCLHLSPTAPVTLPLFPLQRICQAASPGTTGSLSITLSSLSSHALLVRLHCSCVQVVQASCLQCLASMACCMASSAYAAVSIRTNYLVSEVMPCMHLLPEGSSLNGA